MLIAACLMHFTSWDMTNPNARSADLSVDRIVTGKVLEDLGNTWRIETCGLDLSLHDMCDEEYMIEKEDCVVREYIPKKRIE